MQFQLKTHDARRLAETATANGMPAYETWVIHEKDPGCSVIQVALFRHKDGWVLWPGNVWGWRRDLGRELETLRNQ